MRLTLNQNHTLCQPNKNLVFATFGTGAGSTVEDLSTCPAVGVWNNTNSASYLRRTLSSNTPGNLPTDYQALAFRESTTADRVSFGSPTKVTSLTSLTVAAWVKRYNSANAPYGIFHTWPDTWGGQAINGWELLSSHNGYSIAGKWSFHCWKDTNHGYAAANDTVPVGSWQLLTVVYDNAVGATFYRNGELVATQQSAANLLNGGPRQELKIGVNNYLTSESVAPESDIGPLFVWGSLLNADDVKTLYQDTWGMVNQQPKTRFMSFGVVIPPSAPTILNPTSINTTIGTLFTTSISGSNSPTSYSYSNYPRWLNLNTTTGLLSGTPPIGVAKNPSLTIYAANAVGSGSQTLSLNLVKSPTSSGFTTKARASRPYSQGGKTVFTGGTIIYQSGYSNIAQNTDLGGRLDQGKYYGG